jgi:hypothetical protein
MRAVQPVKSPHSVDPNTYCDRAHGTIQDNSGKNCALSHEQRSPQVASTPPIARLRNLETSHLRPIHSRIVTPGIPDRSTLPGIARSRSTRSMIAANNVRGTANWNVTTQERQTALVPILNLEQLLPKRRRAPNQMVATDINFNGRPPRRPKKRLDRLLGENRLRWTDGLIARGVADSSGPVRPRRPIHPSRGRRRRAGPC